MRKLPFAPSLVVCLCLLPLASCRPGPASSPLGGTEWVLSSLHGRSLLAGTRITLHFDAEVSGTSGCNDYRGEYDASGNGALRTSDLVVTAMLCRGPEGIMEQESSYLGALLGSVTYRMAEGRLELANDRGETVLVFDQVD